MVDMQSQIMKMYASNESSKVDSKRLRPSLMND